MKIREKKCFQMKKGNFFWHYNPFLFPDEIIQEKKPKITKIKNLEDFRKRKYKSSNKKETKNKNQNLYLNQNSNNNLSINIQGSKTSFIPIYTQQELSNPKISENQTIPSGLDLLKKEPLKDSEFGFLNSLKDSNYIPPLNVLTKTKSSDLLKKTKTITSRNVNYNADQFFQKGCFCKNTECLKKYCSCFKSGNVCSSFCECINCENNEYSQKKINKLKSMKEKMFGVVQKKETNRERIEEIKNFFESQNKLALSKSQLFSCNGKILFFI